MATESGRKLYNQRPRIAETTFGIMKSVMGLRQFLLRGLAKVKTEWRWATTAFNVIKLVRVIGRLRGVQVIARGKLKPGKRGDLGTLLKDRL